MTLRESASQIAIQIRFHASIVIVDVDVSEGLPRSLNPLLVEIIVPVDYEKN